eukprot:TRINITY_DN143_c0_g1_i3.p1 TRINITY_DN143_c0_g1~~TRINITY_DN143_c0_g1_i3.p1  ORF type:complete len:537 (+),score=98.95 TRINITY_DN143_c0_g1_i3:71-1681(+)
MAAGLTREDLRVELSDFTRAAIREEFVLLKTSLIEVLAPHGAGRHQHTGSRELWAETRKPSFAAADTATEAQGRVPLLHQEAVHGAFPMEESSDSSKPLRRPEEEGYTRANEKKVESSPILQGTRNFKIEGVKERLQKEEHGFLTRCAMQIAVRAEFEQVSALVVLLNAAWIGVKADHVARTWSHAEPELFHVLDVAFCVPVVLEVVIRMVAKGWSFFSGEGRNWNMFDLVITVCQLADLFIKGNSSISTLRALKLVRILRVARIASAFPDLHILISSIIESLNSLFWTMVLILLFLYAVALLIVDTVNDHKIEFGRKIIQEEQHLLIEYWGSVDQAMLSLYMTLTQGIGWVDLLEPLTEYISPWMKVVFVLFIGFQLFAMLNIITACFVDNALKLAVRAEAKGVLHSLWTLFGNEDMEAKDLQIAFEDFMRVSEDPQMQKFFALIGVENQSPEYVFGLIDTDGDGNLSADEFLRGCARLIGPAKSTEVVHIASELNGNIKAQDKLIVELQKGNAGRHDEVKGILHELKDMISSRR